jgi:hypothetical protein
MRVSRVGRFASVCLAVVCLIIAGCSRDNSLEGAYHGGAMVLDFKGDKVTFTAMGESRTFDYKVEGDTVTIVNPAEGNLVLTRNSDGSLNSAIGPFKKKAD